MSQTRVLLVDDELQLVRALRINLEARDYEVHAAPDGAQALALAARVRPHVVVLDLGLPDTDGVQVIRSLRGWSSVPILVVSARRDLSDKVQALDAGADDYLAKPFAVAELLARLRAAVRRGETAAGDPVVRTASFTVDLAAGQVFRDGERVHLSATSGACWRCWPATPVAWSGPSSCSRRSGTGVRHRNTLSAALPRSPAQEARARALAPASPDHRTGSGRTAPAVNVFLRSVAGQRNDSQPAPVTRSSPVPTVNARATAGAGKPFEATTIERREPGPKDVVIDIAYAGICHSDIHTGRGEWHDQVAYPLVPGHEIAGTVSAVGREVTGFKVGDRAGVGCMVDSCGQCDMCKADREQDCRKGMVGTYDGILDGNPTDGGYSQSIVVSDRFALKVPESIPLDAAAPLMCAGITLYSPLKHWGAGPGKRVAIVGMGGLGHMGVQIAKAMGAEVTVISRTRSKEADGKRFGADHYEASSEDGTFTRLANSFDLIVSTISAGSDVADYLGMLDVEGTYVTVGAPPEPFTVPAFALIGGRRSLSGSNIGGIAETQEMLDFCAEHDIAAQVEVIDADDIDSAWDRVVDSDVRYRFVIDAATIA